METVCVNSATPEKVHLKVILIMLVIMLMMNDDYDGHNPDHDHDDYDDLQYCPGMPSQAFVPHPPLSQLQQQRRLS